MVMRRVPCGASDGALARRDGLLLPSHTRLLVVLPLAELLQDASLLALFLESADGAVDRLVLLDANPCHAHYSPSRRNGGFDLGAPRETQRRHPSTVTGVGTLGVGDLVREKSTPRPPESTPPSDWGVMLNFSRIGPAIRSSARSRACRGRPQTRHRACPPARRRARRRPRAFSPGCRGRAWRTRRATRLRPTPSRAGEWARRGLQRGPERAPCDAPHPPTPP